MFRTALLVAVAYASSLPSPTPAEDGTLRGKVLDATGEPVSGAALMVCDAETGIPVSTESYRPFTKEMQFQQLVIAMTDEQGAFTVLGVKPGVYRLIAQSWEDAEKPVRQLLEVNGRVVHLRGIVPQVSVPSDDATKLTIQPLGTATLDITTAPQAPNDETLIVVSGRPLAADPILGFAAWSGAFMPHMFTGNRMPHGKTTFRGLPAGTVHVAAFAADNNPGFGGLTCELTAGQTTVVSVPLIASWSDGHKEPPERLAALVSRLMGMNGVTVMDLIRKKVPDAAKALETARGQAHDPWSALIPVLDQSMELEDGQQVLLKDLLAADAYAQLAKQDEDRTNRQKQSQRREMKIDSEVTYEQALRDLHDRLKQDYPCFQLKGIDWRAVGERLLPRAKGVGSDEEFGLLCLEMVAALEDSHAQLLPAAAQIPSIPFPQWDAGFACLADDRDEPVVYYVATGSSAASAGIQVGMTVEAINGVESAAAIQKAMEQLSRYAGYSSQRYLRYHAFHFFARQPQQGQEITLQVSDTQGRSQTLSMRANRRAGYIPRLPVPIVGISDSGDVSWKMLDEEIGYIYVRRIKANLIDSLDQAVKQLNGARGLIVDVRGNSGGGFDAARAHRNFDLEDNTEPSRPRFTRSIALLIDSRCISAGEGWASWFVARKRGKLFGEATAGASARKTVYTLTNGLFRVQYPVKAYQGYLDRPIERRGLEPDVVVTPNAQDLADGRDTVLETAKKYLLELADRR